MSGIQSPTLGKIKTELETADIEIGAVEIKDSTSDTRAKVGVNGLEVEVKASTLPTGASTEAKQLPDNHNVTVSNIANTPVITGFATATAQTTANTYLGGIAGLTPEAYDYIALTYTGDNLTGVVFKSGGVSGTTKATLALAYTGARLDSVTKT